MEKNALDMTMDTVKRRYSCCSGRFSALLHPGLYISVDVVCYRSNDPFHTTSAASTLRGRHLLGTFVIASQVGPATADVVRRVCHRTCSDYVDAPTLFLTPSFHIIHSVPAHPARRSKRLSGFLLLCGGRPSTSRHRRMPDCRSHESVTTILSTNRLLLDSCCY